MPPGKSEKRRRGRDDSPTKSSKREATEAGDKVGAAAKRRKKEPKSTGASSVRKGRKTATVASTASEVVKGAAGQAEPCVTPEALHTAGVADCAALRDSVLRLHAIAGGAKPTAEVRELVMAGLLLGTDLKRVVRTSHRNWKDAEEDTMSERALVDARYLQLQNVMFEKMHVHNEINRCEQFRSRHHDLDLAAPEEALNADAITGVLDDPHQLMLARLEAERKERQRLLTEHLRLRHVKVDAEQAFDAKRDQLQKLPQLLQEVLAAANPMIDFFEIAESDEGASAHGDSAAYLPTPLYVLYSCLADFRTLSKDAYTVKVTGDLKAAKDPAVLKLWEGDANVSADSAMQLESEAQELARRYGTDETESIEQQAKAAKRRLLRKHPLSIDLELVDGPKLQFGYLLELRVVTVSIADVADDAALQYMYPNDVGTELPTEASAHKMEESGLNPYAEYAAKLGRPYKWAQLISGCPVDGEAAGPTVESRLRRRNMTRVVPDIIAHAKAARSLAAQLERLSALDVSVGPGLGVEVERVLFPLPTSTSLSSWAQASDEAELSTYAAILTRGDTTLRLTVAVSKMYPMVPPKFTIVIDDEGKSVADDDVSRVDPNVEAMEREVNVHFDELIEKVEPSLLLMLQMRRLQMCVDIFSEYAAIEAGKKQTVSKLFERASGGQDRLRPFVFDHTQGVFVHRKKL